LGVRARKADSSGADIISSSLGYMTFDNASLNHTYADMNGNTTMAAIAADLAAKKGCLYLFPTEILELVAGIICHAR
jgi:hypothetical protein